MALDEDDITKIQALFKAGMDAFKTDVLPGALTQGIKTATKDMPTAESIALAIKTATEAKPPADKKPPADPDADPQLAALQAQVATLTTQNQQSADRAKAAEASSKADRLQGGVRQALLDSGVPSKHVGAALTVVMSEGNFSLDDAGAVVFEQPAEFGGTEMVAVDAGAQAFLSTDVGRIFLPPTSSPENSEGPTGVDAHNVGDPGQILTNALNNIMGA